MYHHPISVLALSRAIQQQRLASVRRPPARVRSRIEPVRRPKPVPAPTPTAVVCPEQRRAS
jgi:hypothetical protein